MNRNENCILLVSQISYLIQDAIQEKLAFFASLLYSVTSTNNNDK